jgi:hypothetical protein
MVPLDDEGMFVESHSVLVHFKMFVVEMWMLKC